jgi:tetratricopeptide (TPR) repeat protein
LKPRSTNTVAQSTDCREITMKAKLAGLLVIAIASLCAQGCGAALSSTTSTERRSAPAAAPLPSEAEARAQAVRWLEARVKGDPDDITAQNKLGGYYLQLLRETGNLTYLELATRAAQASLKSVNAEMNRGGLGLLTQAEFAAHNFAAARNHAQQLVQMDGGKAYPYQLLGDAQLELGEYDAATASFKKLAQLAPGDLSTETRLARLAALRGDHQRARGHYENALQAALAAVPPARETVAWCRWQLGETVFNAGDYEAAEKYYRDALTTFPDYYRALAGLGRVRAARGDLPGAIEQYERATRLLPEPVTVAALGDLYQLAGRTKEAAAQYALCEQLARLGKAKDELYNRQLALFYADHDLKAEEAYQAALREYAVRRDIHGADALAWTALKAGKLVEAQQAIKDALRLGTQEARLFYHAGMIAQAAGNRAAARDYLQRALKLNPQFDPLQAKRAAEAVAN